VDPLLVWIGGDGQVEYSIKTGASSGCGGAVAGDSIGSASERAFS
jgi:hypothetical protein